MLKRTFVFYKGPQDNQERYYRISWTDEPVTEFEASKKEKKQGEATTSAIIGTILVVAPRKKDLTIVAIMTR